MHLKLVTLEEVDKGADIGDGLKKQGNKLVKTPNPVILISTCVKNQFI